MPSPRVHDIFRGRAQSGSAWHRRMTRGSQQFRGREERSQVAAPNRSEPWSAVRPPAPLQPTEGHAYETAPPIVRRTSSRALYLPYWCPQGDTIHIPVIGGAAEARTVDLSLQPPDRVGPARDLAALSGNAELPPYIVEVVKAVAQGVQTSREFATHRGIFITNASERFRAARRLGWIVPVDGRYLPRGGIRYRMSPSRFST